VIGICADGPTSVKRVEPEADLIIEHAYETAFRFVWQYYQRETSSESLALMLVSMEPTTDHAKTDDPASWADWEDCVAKTLRDEPLPGFPAESPDLP
jgi:hypothetical protein